LCIFFISFFGGKEKGKRRGESIISSMNSTSAERGGEKNVFILIFEHIGRKDERGKEKEKEKASSYSVIWH